MNNQIDDERLRFYFKQIKIAIPMLSQRKSLLGENAEIEFSHHITYARKNQHLPVIEPGRCCLYFHIYFVWLRMMSVRSTGSTIFPSL